MWRLLDIRTGRANRGQFYFVLLLCGFALSGLLRIESISGGVAGLAVLSYIAALMIVRRYRDMNPFPKENQFLSVLGALGLLVGSFFLMIILIPILVVTNGKSVLGRKVFGETFQAVGEDILNPFIDILFKPSTPHFTPYGLPPRGLNFLTMTFQTYPPNMRKQALDDTKHVEDTEKSDLVADEESQGVEDLLLKQAHKAERRKRFLYTEAYDVEDI